jgi:hypothetical protein
MEPLVDGHAFARLAAKVKEQRSKLDNAAAKRLFDLFKI